MRHSAWPVVLVSMPFMDPYRPSIQLGLLKAVTARCGFPVRTYHAYLDFAVQIGIDYYEQLCENHGTLIGDWLFSLEAFGDAAPDPGAHMLDEFADRLSCFGTSPEEAREKLLRTRSLDVPLYLDALIDGFPWEDVAVVGLHLDLPAERRVICVGPAPEAASSEDYDRIWRC